MNYDGRVDRVRCELAWSADLLKWRRFRASKYETDDGKLPFASKDEDELIPLQAGTYLSHDCFAAKPVEVQGEGVRIYFMGGDGPHFGRRNTTFAMAKLRSDGFVGVRSQQGLEGRLVTQPLTAVGQGIYVTADLGAVGSLQVQVVDPDTMEPKEGVPEGRIHDSRSVTDQRVLHGVASGTKVRLVFTLRNAELYSFGFEQETEQEKQQ